MDFYKTILIVATINLIVILAIFGVILSNMSKSQIFPGNISQCPDYYSLSTLGKCATNSVIYSNNKADCKNADFTDPRFDFPGTNKKSGLCEKKKWAIKCGVSWDGITNNSNICY